MKKIISIILTGIISTLTADISNIVSNPEPVFATTPATSNLAEKLPQGESGFFYIRFAAAGNQFSHVDSILPGLGIGYRCPSGNGAADISISGIGRSESKGRRFFWTLPKASYIQYLSPDQKQSAYVGGGLAWGGVRTKQQQHFIGIIPNFTTGYEFVHRGNILSFMELNISQPAIAIYKRGAFIGPIAECTVGMGF